MKKLVIGAEGGNKIQEIVAEDDKILNGSSRVTWNTEKGCQCHPQPSGEAQKAAAHL